jgi:hypothetical protein
MVMLRSEDDLSLSIRRGFVRILSDLRPLLYWSFKYEKPEQRSESVSEAIAFAFVMYKSARESGKQLDARPLAHYAALRVKSGARFCGTHRLDATNSQTLHGRRPFDCRSLAQTSETLIADRKGHWPVSDQVAFRIDWTEFSKQCSRRDRFIMSRLAAGYRRNEVAQELDVTPPAITQRMNQVRHRWQAFQA